MINTNDLQNEIVRLSSLKTLIETYEEIAANRMRKNRSIVLASRAFNEGVGTMYKEIKSSYRSDLLKLMRQKHIMKTNSLSLIKKNGKSVCLLLSSNAGLYGNIVPRITEQFINYVQKSTSDIAIIGRLGRRLFEERNLHKQYTYFDFPDMNTDPILIENLGKFLIAYEKIYIFYGKFESVGVQTPTVLDVIGKEEQKEEVQKGPALKYLFEPSLEQIMIFFEEQMFTSIIEQAVKESELAKFASRMINLDTATENVKASLKTTMLKKRILLHRQQNKKQQELFYGMRLWKK